MEATGTQSSKSRTESLKGALAELRDLDGFIAAAVADSSSGMMLGSEQGNSNFDINVAAAVNTEVVKAKMKAMKALKLSTGIEDILITLGDQYHLIRPLRDNPALFFYLALDRQSSNLALARISLSQAEQSFKM